MICRRELTFQFGQISQIGELVLMICRSLPIDIGFIRNRFVFGNGLFRKCPE